MAVYTHTDRLTIVLCQHIIVCRDAEIARTDGLLMVGGNSDSRLLLPMSCLW